MTVTLKLSITVSSAKEIVGTEESKDVEMNQAMEEAEDKEGTVNTSYDI